jgi:arsenical pump membrane protein
MGLDGAAALGIFAAAIVLLLARPRRLPDWAAALGGGVLMLVVGLLPLSDALRELLSAWNVWLFFVGLAISAAVAEHAGLFRAAATLAARLAHGSQPRLLIGLYVAGAAITAVLSNDATALLLTPVGLAIARDLEVDPLPYVFACALVANAASFVLPVSNPANLLVLAQAPLPLGTYLSELLLPSVAALSVTLLGLLVVFRTSLAQPLKLAGTTPDDASFAALQTRANLIGVASFAAPRTRANLIGVIVLAAGYLVGSALGWPLGSVAVGGAILLVVLDVVAQRRADLAWLHAVPWGLFPLFGGLLLLVTGAAHQGSFDPLVRLVDAVQSLGDASAPLAVIGFGITSNVMNNLPAALVAATALGGLPGGAHRSEMVAGTLIGLDLGPNLTPVGALSNLLWLLLLRRGGLHVSTASYLRVALIVSLPAVAAAALCLWLLART